MRIFPNVNDSDPNVHFGYYFFMFVFVTFWFPACVCVCAFAFVCVYSTVLSCGLLNLWVIKHHWDLEFGFGAGLSLPPSNAHTHEHRCAHTHTSHTYTHIHTHMHTLLSYPIARFDWKTFNDSFVQQNSISFKDASLLVLGKSFHLLKTHIRDLLKLNILDFWYQNFRYFSL